MINLSCCNFFKFFIYHPNSTLLSTKDQKIARIARKTLSVLSVTLIPRFCKAKWSNRNVWSQNEKTVLCANIKAFIQASKATPLPPDKDTEKTMCSTARKVPCNLILHGLYLGNGIGFAEATDLIIPTNNPDQPMQNSNAYRFNSVITYCPIGQATSYCALNANADVEHVKEADISQSFARQRVDGRMVNWLNYGITAMDDVNGWKGIVHDSTFPNTELASETVKEGQAAKDMLTKKGAKVDKTKVKDWFQEAFKEIDGAVFHNRRVLVHCMVGASRSASVLAAYLINRFDVTAEEALAFLKSKRYCVLTEPLKKDSKDSNFVNDLQNYQQALSAERNKELSP